MSDNPTRPRVVVQRVETTWTKESRGAPGATVRNAVPTGFALPSPLATCHLVTAAEHEDFLPVATWSEEVDADTAYQLDLRVDGGRVSVRPRVSPWWAPPRPRRPARTPVAAGSWLRWSINHRTGYPREWVYGLVTFNVAHDPADPADLDVFLGEPDVVVDELASLR